MLEPRLNRFYLVASTGHKGILVAAPVGAAPAAPEEPEEHARRIVRKYSRRPSKPVGKRRLVVELHLAPTDGRPPRRRLADLPLAEAPLR